MTDVLCDFDECNFYKGGHCTKDKIYLDERVNDIYVGCPDAEWSVWERMEVRIGNNDF